VTQEGRMVAMVLMTAGVGLFGTFSAFLASWFLGGAAEQDEAHREIAALRHEVAQLREDLKTRL
jgi:voltage-gated potassium channel